MGKKGKLLGHNIFRYCANNPIGRIDSDGLYDINNYSYNTNYNFDSEIMFLRAADIETARSIFEQESYKNNGRNAARQLALKQAQEKSSNQKIKALLAGNGGVFTAENGVSVMLIKEDAYNQIFRQTNTGGVELAISVMGTVGEKALGSIAEKSMLFELGGAALRI